MHRATLIASLVPVALLLWAQGVDAFWRLPCTKPALTARIDPIVGPIDGTPTSHTHTFMGAGNIAFNSTYESLQESNCSTCALKDDLSSYWEPLLYYQFDNGTFIPVNHGGMLVYYLQRGAKDETIKAFPPGFRMVTGNPMARHNSGSPASKAISWNCINYDKPQPQTPGFNNTDCPQGLRAQVFFPGCWDGVNLDSADHESHVAYPSGIDNGRCPSSHPVHLISIFYEIYYDVATINKLKLPGRYVLANGDPTGYGLHGDFLNGWNQDILQKAVDQCTNLSGVIEDCPVFEGRYFTQQERRSCQAADPFPEDNVLSPGTKLPGCVEVTDGPEDAPMSSMVCPTTDASTGSDMSSGDGSSSDSSTTTASPSTSTSTTSSSSSSSSSDASASPSDSSDASASEPSDTSSSSSSSSPTADPTGTRPAITKCKAKATDTN